MTDFLWTRPEGAPAATLLLAHGAGAAMDSPFMNRFAATAASLGLAVARFEFPYMAERRATGKKRPPPRADKLIDAYLAAISDLGTDIAGPLLIGGKSMGGRIAVMCAGDPALDKRVAGVVCLGYPFHPQGKPEELRLEPLRGATLPCLIAQGERDPFGTPEEIATYDLPAHVRLVVLEDGSHDLAPRGRSPATWDGNMRQAAEAARAFAEDLPSAPA
ncbi:alpha/beta family hydrolase [Breoghania sp. L-A4]|uniref:alpha/beta family hydrolase n=1 Tax=Breoghania sp. L-A4 TaxID=2304600 RepID=UPI000E35F2E9|nr:alpha/beta family hydrolase [Breoghania sp. L-A4]AXS39624.1 alpha/beta hydrolase [Breoghania sp. L-A4]